MTGKSPVKATDEQRIALRGLAGSPDRSEADRARGVLLTLAGWTCARIGRAFGVREDTVRLWRCHFVTDGVDGLKTKVAAGPEPVKSRAALKVAADVLSEPVANRVNWTLPRLIDEIERREEAPISRSRLSATQRKKGAFASGALGTLRRVAKTRTRSIAAARGSSCLKPKPRPAILFCCLPMRARR